MYNNTQMGTNTFHCLLCNVKSSSKFNHNKHLNTMKHKKKQEEHDSLLKNSDEPMMDTHLRDMVLNMSKSLNAMKDERINMTHILDGMKAEINTLREKNNLLMKEVNLLKENVGKQVTINNTVNNNTVNNNTVNNNTVNNEVHHNINVQVIDWQSGEIEHMTLQEQFTIAKSRTAIEDMVKALHFDERVPEQKNVTIPNKRLPHMKVYSVCEGGWILMDKRNGLDMLKNEALTHIIDWESRIKKYCSKSQQERWYKMVRDAQGTDGKLSSKREKEIRKTIELIILNNQ